MNTDPKEQDKGDRNSQQKKSPLDEKKNEDNELQRGLTGETDDEEDVSGDLAGNAGGNSED